MAYPSAFSLSLAHPFPQMPRVESPQPTQSQPTPEADRRPGGAGSRKRQPRFPERMAFRPDIEGLRGVAILIGVLYHLDVPIPGGIAGMDIFFPMSGFLITTLLAIEFQKNRIAVKKRSQADKVFPKLSRGTTAVSTHGANSGNHRGGSGRSSEVAAGSVSLSAFFGRRIRRLMPAALATIAVVLIVSKLLFNEIRFTEVQHDAFCSTFWLENFHLIS